MKLRYLATAASVLVAALAATSCSKSPKSANAAEPEKSSQPGPPSAEIHQHLQDTAPSGVTIRSLETEAKPGPSAGTFEINFKLGYETAEDFLAMVTDTEAFKRYGIIWRKVPDTPGFYELKTKKGTSYTAYGKLLAEKQIDRWNLATMSFDGDQPEGRPATSIQGKYILIDSNEAKAFFKGLADQDAQRERSLVETREAVENLFRPGSRFQGEAKGSKTFPLELVVDSGESGEETDSKGFWSLRGTLKRGDKEMQVEGNAWLEPQTEPPTATISLKAKESANAVSFYKVRFVGGALQPIQGESPQTNLHLVE